MLYTNNSTTLSILEIVEDTTVDGTGFRTAIYAAGCAHACKGCHNPQSWQLEHGKGYTLDSLLHTITANPFANVTFTGGDPLFQAEGFTLLAQQIKRETNKTIWCYTGYTYEQIVANKRLSPLLPYIDVLVDGRYEESLRDTNLPFRGSSNQRIIDIPQSLQQQQVVLWNRG